MTPEQAAALEEERDFLLASIRDLEREHTAGDVDEEDFRSLRDGYVARASRVLRDLESGRLPAVTARRAPRWKRLLVPVLTLLVAAGLGLAVARAAGQRLPGQTVTGGLPSDGVATLLADARRVLLSDAAGALAAYDRVLEIEPANAEAVTYRAWLIVLGARGSGDEELLAAQLAELERATSIDPSYADPHCFLAVASARFVDPPQSERARVEAQACLDRDPPGALVPGIEALLDE